MSDGGAAEVAACQRPDVRQTTRLARLFGRLRARPVGSMPTACHGGAATGAASRLRHNPNSAAPESLAGHTHATRARLRAQESVWLVQETTFLHDGTTQPQAGMGTVKSKPREAYLRQPPVVLTPERVN
jgi:Transposase DNA-binding